MWPFDEVAFAKEEFVFSGPPERKKLLSVSGELALIYHSLPFGLVGYISVIPNLSTPTLLFFDSSGVVAAFAKFVCDKLLLS